jgi:hypothetical protein
MGLARYGGREYVRKRSCDLDQAVTGEHRPVHQGREPFRHGGGGI